MIITIEHALARLESLIVKLSDAGHRTPGGFFTVYPQTGSEPFYFRLHYKTSCGETVEFSDFHTPSMEEILRNAEAWVDAQETPEKAAKRSALKLMSDAIEAGRQAGFEDSVLNPIAQAMQDMSKNLLEYHEV